MSDRHYEIAIVGAGPAGLSAALYASRAMHKTLLIEEKIPGGELLNTDLIEDYPGFASITGASLAQKMTEQALSFGAHLEQGRVVLINKLVDGSIELQMEEGDVFTANSVIITAGGHPRKLEVVGEEEYAGKGVSYCAVCDGAFFKGQHLAVIGGGDAALEEADFLTRYASKVTVIHRRDELRAQPLLVARAKQNSKVDFILNTEVEEILGNNGKVRALRLLKNKETTLIFKVTGVFIFIGFLPNTKLVKEHIEHDIDGYYITDDTMQTSIAGIYAAGDLRSQPIKQIVNAAGDGAIAAMMASKYLAKLRKYL